LFGKKSLVRKFPRLKANLLYTNLTQSMPLAWALLFAKAKCNFLTLLNSLARDNNPLCLLLIKANNPAHNSNAEDTGLLIPAMQGAN
jgi:hypothetical protein